MEDSVTPYHLGFVPDGFRRWAKENRKSLFSTYFRAKKMIDSILHEVFGRGTKIISVYFLSKDNLKRSPDHLNVTLWIQQLAFGKLFCELAHKWNCRVKYAGNIDLIQDEKYKKKLIKICKDTEHYTERTVYLLIVYDPIEEIEAANIKSAQNGKSLFSNLWVPHPVDLFIRTGKVTRTSKFLPLQLVYAELFFIDKYLPDITPDDIKEIYQKYMLAEKRYGK